MQEFRCEYQENGARVVLRGLLRDIQRTVGSRQVRLDGVLGHFTMANDGHASVLFVQARSSRVRGEPARDRDGVGSDDDDLDGIAENDDAGD